jgi:hypothetical protein
MHVALWQRDTSWHADVTIVGANGVAETSHLETTGPDCTALFNATTLAVAVALEHEPEASSNATTQEPTSRNRVEAPSPHASAGSSGNLRRTTTVQAPGPTSTSENRRDNWLSLELAQDLFVMPSRSDLCSPETQRNGNVECFEGTDSFVGQTVPRYGGGATNGGVVFSTERLLASYERALSRHLGALVRAGFAFGKTPPQPASGASPFLPIHLELDARYWFGRDVFGERGLQGYVSAGVGIAEYVGAVHTTILDCTETTCSPVSGALAKDVIAYQRGGQLFGTLAGAAVWAFDDNFSAFFRAGAVFTFPAEAFVLEPSLGLMVGF